MRRLVIVGMVVPILVLAGPAGWVGQASAQSPGGLSIGHLLEALFGSSTAPSALLPPPPPPPANQATPPPPPVAQAAPIVAPPETLPPNSGSGRRVVYEVSAQRVWLVESGEAVIGSWPVSGRRGEPPPGNYSVFSRSRQARAKIPGVTMEYMVRFAPTQGLDIGFHAIPVNRRGRPIQGEEELGTFQSLGCVRQSRPDAIRMWDFAQIGTPVVVLP
jgi:lipoprotein-anchoring transpeptidase ErfK/SrfK